MITGLENSWQSGELVQRAVARAEECFAIGLPSVMASSIEPTSVVSPQPPDVAGDGARLGGPLAIGDVLQQVLARYAIGEPAANSE